MKILSPNVFTNASLIEYSESYHDKEFGKERYEEVNKELYKKTNKLFELLDFFNEEEFLPMKTHRLVTSIFKDFCNKCDKVKKFEIDYSRLRTYYKEMITEISEHVRLTDEIIEKLQIIKNDYKSKPKFVKVFDALVIEPALYIAKYIYTSYTFMIKLVYDYIIKKIKK